MSRTLLEYYKLSAAPFGVTPDPAFLFLSPTHREALASMLHGVRSGRGFTALIAEPGMGKTTLLFALLRKLKGTPRVAFLFQMKEIEKTTETVFSKLEIRVNPRQSRAGIGAAHPRQNEDPSLAEIPDWDPELQDPRNIQLGQAFKILMERRVPQENHLVLDENSVRVVFAPQPVKQ